MRSLFWFLIILLVGIRIIVYYQTKPSYPDGTKIRISGKVSSEPIQYQYSQRVILQGFKMYLPFFPEVHYGDNLVVEGIVEKDKINGAEIVDFTESTGFLFALRKRLLDFYQRNLPLEHSALVAGVTIGSKSGVSKNFWELLKASGTIHVVVASGMNVTLVAGFLMGFLVNIIPRRRAIPLALIGIWGYSLMSGFDAPIVRAAVMGSIAFTAQEIGRIYFAWRALIFSVIGMLLIKPVWITDLGFILSFVATASLMLFESKINKLIHFVRPNFLKKDLSTTLAAQIGVAPILFATFGQFNILSPIINALVLWTVAPITIIGMLGGMAGLIFEPAGRLILLLSYPLTSWFIFVVKHTG